MSNKYWQSFGELKGSEELAKRMENEFQEELPFEDRNEKGWLDATAPRRDFLKYLGFSTAAAAIAAGCKTHIRKAVPFANKPAEVIPGVSKYYATTYVQDGDVLPILAKVRDGRPIKIEGNDQCSYTGGGTSARAQASVLDLYDMNRLKQPRRKVGDKFEEVPTFEQLDKMIGDAMAGVTKAYLLTSTITSPTTKEIISKYPNLTHVQYDADSFNGMLMANQSTFGRKAIPSYDFSKAKVIVSLGADFLGTWLNPVEFARQYVQMRKLKDGATEMSRHLQFESYLSTTGASADERFTHRPSEAGAVASALLAALSGNAPTTTVSDSAKAGITKAAAELSANKGAALVISGSNDVNVQTIVNAINNAIGAYGPIIDWSTTLNFRQGTDDEFEQMLTNLDGNSAIMVYGANPAYNYHNQDKFKKAFAKAKVRISFNEYLDETTDLCNYAIPSHHFLESWGDAEPKSGYISFIQPTIHPLFKTRAFQTSLLKWSGNNTDYETYFRNYWEGKLGSRNSFDTVLEKGVIDPKASQNPVVTTTPVSDSLNTKPATATVQRPVASGSAGSFNNADVEKAAAGISGNKKGTGLELALYQKVSIGTGKQGTNPWLQELPDPITKATWDNYVLMSMPKAKEIVGVDLINGSERHINDYEYYPEKPIVSISIGGAPAFELPVLIVPGMDVNTVAIAVGYGRSEKLGQTAGNVGKNVYPYSSSNGTTRDYYFAGDIKITNTGRKERVAQAQVHNSYEHRTEVVKETSLATFNKDRKQFKKFREELVEDFAPKTKDFRKEATIYPDHPQPGLKWGMSVDMNSCVACGACVVACHAENNVPVVGKSEVARYHDMHWLRIDRYFVSDEKNPDNLKSVVFQPMMCQHCDNAPCENVCPVAATNHNSEGINQMAYNRCIGTRYCANNCPYKVRRFNWADYTGADSFPDNQDQKLVGKLDPVVHQMNDDLTRMVLNPDVTVRSRGVMEKCSFCVQRLQEAKLTAKKNNEVLEDGKAVTACMQACPTNAIVFGNVKDKNSQIAKTRAENDDRLFYVIEQIHTLPNVNYLAKIRNTNEVLEIEEYETPTTEEHTTEEKKA